MEWNSESIASYTWKGATKSFNHVKGGFGWKIGTENNVSIWFDVWIHSEPLCLLVSDIHLLEILWTVNDIIQDGRWNLALLRTNIPYHIKTLSADILILTTNATDEFVRKGSKDAWSWIWKLRCPQRFRFLAWLIMHDRLLTNAYMSHIRMTEDDLYPHCYQHSETILHILRDCHTSKALWNGFIPVSKRHWFFMLDTQTWLRGNTTT